MQASAKLTRRLLMIMVILLVALVALSPNIMSAYAGLGDYISEKLLGGTGATSASLYLGDSAGGPVVLGSGPLITTLAVTDATLPATGTTATLRGNLASLNGLPLANVWFVWGYTPATMTNITPVVVVLAVGDQTSVITGYDPQEVFYQFQASTDGTSLGSVRSFAVSGGRGTAFWLMWNILTLVIAMGLFILVLKLTRNPIAALVGTIIAIIGITIVRGMIQSML